MFIANAIVLGWLGGKPPEGLYVLASRLCTLYYFAYFVVILPLLGKFERTRPLPASIAEAVLGTSGSASAMAGSVAASPSTKG